MWNFDWTQTAKATMILFAVIDIIGSIPLIINIKKKAGKIHPGKVVMIAGGIMLAFLFLGEQILYIIGIDVRSFAVAGSFILFFMALEMVLGHDFFKEEETNTKVASIVPLAFPLIAGAGSMTSIISLRAEFAGVNIVIAILINMVIVWLVLRLTNRIERFLGDGGIAVLRKIFGIILLAIAVKLFSSNVTYLFP
jgi:multiple antibiotic resistance protein